MNNCRSLTTSIIISLISASPEQFSHVTVRRDATRFLQLIFSAHNVFSHADAAKSILNRYEAFFGLQIYAGPDDLQCMWQHLFCHFFFPCQWCIQFNKNYIKFFVFFFVKFVAQYFKFESSSNSIISSNGLIRPSRRIPSKSSKRWARDLDFGRKPRNQIQIFLFKRH